MNQTVTINIGGIVFHIEIDAYEELKNYLNKIKSYFNNSQEREEIMSDIEARIAELFNQKISDVNQVVLMKDVEEVIEVMGKPEQYLSEDEDENSEYTNTSNESSQRIGGKKFFRNPDERVLGGVCSGIAAYFGFDTIWARLFFVMTTMFMGFGPAIYIILWIVIPEAKTASDKLQMKGEPINVDNIGKKVEEEATKMNEKLRNVNTSSFGQFLEKFFNTIGMIIQTIFKVAGKLIGLFLLMLGAFLAIWFIIGLFDDSIVLSYTSAGISAIESSELLELIFSSHDHFIIFLTAIILVIGIPIIGLIYGGIRLLFKVKGNIAVTISLAILWFVAFFTALTIGLTAAGDQKAEQKFVKTEVLNSSYTSYLLSAKNDPVPGEMMFEVDDFTLSIDKNNFYSTEIELTIGKSESDSLELITKYISQGKTKKDAIQKVRNIKYSYELSDSTMNFSNYFSALKSDRLRGQRIKMILNVPIGKVIYLDKSIENLVYDIDNVSNTWDHDMMGKSWVMLEDGLTCLDCEKIDGVNTVELDSIMNYKPELLEK